MNTPAPMTDPNSTTLGRRVRALVVEDDAQIAGFLAENLTADRFDVVVAGSGDDALDHLADNAPDIVLLDEGLPDMSGLDLLTTIRAAGPQSSWDPCMPVILVTGRSDEQSIVRGIERGADDYVVKPFGYPELLARIGANLRRASGATLSGRLVVGALQLDRRALTAFVHDTPLTLSAKEFALLAMLARDPSRAIPKANLLRDVWGYTHRARQTRTLDTHASRLRRKLELAGLPGWVRNVWGYGYRLLPEER